MPKAKNLEEKKSKNPFLDKKVTIALVDRLQSSLYKDKEASTLAVGGAKSFTCPIDRSFGNLVDPLTKEEKDYLEELLGMDLNVHNKKGDNFWSTKKAICILRKTGRRNSSANLELNLSDPYHFILYKIALVNPRVANSWVQRYDRREYEFVIIDEGVQLQEELDKLETEDVVIEYLLTNKNSKKKLFDLLRMYGIANASKEVTYSNSTQWMYNELKKAAKRPSEIKKLYDLVSLGEREISDKIFLQDCITIGVINKYGIEYKLVGGSKIGNNEIDAINWLNDKNNSSVKLKFRQAVEDYYTNHK